MMIKVIGLLLIGAQAQAGILRPGNSAVNNASLDSSSVTLQGNSFNSASKLVQLNSTGQVPAVVSTSSLISGQSWLPAHLPSTAAYSNKDNNWSTTQTFQSAVNQLAPLTVNGSSLTVNSGAASRSFGIDAGAAGSPTIVFNQAGTERAYIFYDNSRSEIFFNRGGGAQGLAVNAADAVRIGSGGTPLAVISTGTYTPTLTNRVNLDASGAAQATYYRIGNQVTVYGYFTADPTTTLTSTNLEISLPITSNLENAQDAAGSGSNDIREPLQMSADTTNDTVEVVWTPAGTANAVYTFVFYYTIK